MSDKVCRHCALVIHTALLSLLTESNPNVQATLRHLNQQRTNRLARLRRPLRMETSTLPRFWPRPVKHDEVPVNQLPADSIEEPLWDPHHCTPLPRFNLFTTAQLLSQASTALSPYKAFLCSMHLSLQVISILRQFLRYQTLSA